MKGLPDFYWYAPQVGEDEDSGRGFLIRERPAESFSLTPELELFLVTGPNFQQCRYRPMEETGLLRIFARTVRDAEGCRRFANRYGRLGRGAGAYEPDRPESLSAWLNAASWLRHLLHLWDLSHQRRPAALKQYVYYGSPPVAGFWTNPVGGRPNLVLESYLEMLGGALHDREGQRWAIIPLTTGIVPAELAAEMEDPRRLAVLFCMLFINAELSAASHVAVSWPPKARTPRLRMVPETLWGAMLLQLAESIQENRVHRQCRACEKWFAPGGGEPDGPRIREDKLTCSKACRTALYRRRQERARQLAADGWSVKRIAKEIGARENSVKKWVHDQK